MFDTSFSRIWQQVESIDPRAYGKTRNYLQGAVTRLSPYISRGLISTRQVARAVLKKGFKPYEAEILLKELAWRDYFQQTWKTLGNINRDIRQPQPGVLQEGLPAALAEARTGIEAIDQGVHDLCETGYLHNHLRMYSASLACNIAGCHWMQPARWMYYHLLDADWGSNALSWQWVAGSFSQKKYYANQENINKYCGTQQRNSFLDLPYEAFGELPVPEPLQEIITWEATCLLPEKTALQVDPSKPSYLYHFYNLDPLWGADESANRILLLEPAHFQEYPVSSRSLSFALDLARQNIEGIQVYTGSFEELLREYGLKNIHFKEHPFTRHYTGTEHPRDWLFPALSGYYPSFFRYWKEGSKYLDQLSKD